MTALFLQETKKRGYEAIVRKSTRNNKTYFDIVTNSLPVTDGPYYLWLVNANDKGQICSVKNMGPLTLEPTTKVWQTTFTDADYIDDAQVVVLTNQGFGSADWNEMANYSDKVSLQNLDDPHVILRGFFAQEEFTKEISNKKQPVSTPAANLSNTCEQVWNIIVRDDGENFASICSTKTSSGSSCFSGGRYLSTAYKIGFKGVLSIPDGSSYCSSAKICTMCNNGNVFDQKTLTACKGQPCNP
jgi:hypothetical protein